MSSSFFSAPILGWRYVQEFFVQCTPATKNLSSLFFSFCTSINDSKVFWAKQRAKLLVASKNERGPSRPVQSKLFYTSARFHNETGIFSLNHLGLQAQQLQNHFVPNVPIFLKYVYIPPFQPPTKKTPTLLLQHIS